MSEIVRGGIVGARGGGFAGLIQYHTTTDGTGYPVVTYGRLPAVGDGIGVFARIWGFERGTMDRGFYRVQEGAFNRNAVAAVSNFPFAFNPAYTDPPPSAPWATGATPATWGADAMWQDGNDLQIIAGSTDGLTVDWWVEIHCYLFGTALLLR